MLADVLQPVSCDRNTQFGIPLPHDTWVQYLEFEKRKEAQSSEQQQISQNPRSCLSLSASPQRQRLGNGSRLQCLCFSPVFKSVSYKLWFPWWRVSFGASQIHVQWRDGTRRRRVAWVCNLVNCHLSFAFLTSEQDVGRCFL